jgi:ANTAR domain-containing protein
MNVSSNGHPQASDSRNGRPVRVDGRAFTTSAQNMLQIAVPPGTPVEAERAIERLLELTSVLARRSSQLQEALDSRIVIEQAKGILAERYRIDVEDAFRLLRRASRSNRMRIHDLAARVVASKTAPPEFAALRLPDPLNR